MTGLHDKNHLAMILTIISMAIFSVASLHLAPEPYNMLPIILLTSGIMSFMTFVFIYLYYQVVMIILYRFSEKKCHKPEDGES